MDQARKNRLLRFSYLLNALLFFMGGFAMLGEDKLFIAIVQFTASSLNFVALLFALNPKLAFRFKQAVLVLDSLVAASVALDYLERGTQYIHYAWFFAALMSTIALIIISRREQRSEKAIPE